MSIRLIATDMDGTLLDEEGSLDLERLCRLLDCLDEKEIPFVVASGNGLERLRAILGPLSDRVILVADNGAHIYKEGETFYRHSLAPQLIQEVIAYYGDRLKELCFMLGHNEGIYMPSGGRTPFEDFEAIDAEQLQAFFDKIHRLDKMEQFPRDRTYYKMGMWVPEEEVEAVVSECNQVFVGQLQAVTSGFGSIDLLPYGINKATGLQKVLEPLGLDGGHLMAFGDNDNDREMLLLADQSYAVGHSSQALAKIAKHHLPSNTDSAVMATIEAYLSTEIEKENQ